MEEWMQLLENVELEGVDNIHNAGDAGADGPERGSRGSSCRCKLPLPCPSRLTITAKRHDGDVSSHELRP